jgi:hypothetical protein
VTREPDVSARVLIYDLEVAPSRGYTWGKWQQNVLWFDREWFILSFAYKWLGEKKVHVVALPDFELYETDPYDDIEVVRELHRIMSQTDVAITHNGKNFDNKKANARMSVHNMEPLPPRKEIDTLQVARRQFGFTSNSLGDLCHILGLPAKGKSGGTDTWKDCLDGDPRAWARMKRYNRQDIVTLEALYLRLRPWMAQHPNLNIYGDRPASCPRCGHDNLIVRGYRTAGVTQRVQYQCTECRGYCTGRRVHNTPITYRIA